jgi:hypothetical protein
MTKWSCPHCDAYCSEPKQDEWGWTCGCCPGYVDVGYPDTECCDQCREALSE